MEQFDMEMTPTNRIGKTKMKLLKYMDDEGFVETPRPGRGMLIAIIIGFFLSPVAVWLAAFLGEKIDYWMGEFLKWLFI